MTVRSLRLITAAALLCATVTCVPAAHAGTWIQVSCVNPDGSAASFEGWSGGSSGNPEVGSSNGARCGPGMGMFAELSDAAPAPQGANEYLEYQPPAGSTLIGGVVDLHLSASGGGTSSGDAVLYEPVMSYPSGVFFQCAWSLGPCGPPSTPYDLTGQIALPAFAGGDFFASATCGGNAGTSCSQHESGPTEPWSSVEVFWAHFRLSNSAVPVATGFTGTALDPGVRGTKNLLFTATDTGGPGIYSVTATIDGAAVYSGTPDTNGGACVPVGSDSGALMFAYQQPCRGVEPVSIPITTAGLPDGKHELAVSVTDAAGNTSPVLDQTITTSNPQTTPNPSGRHALHARFVIHWHWQGATTTMRSIIVKHLLRNARVAVRCAGKHCPRLRASARGPRKANAMLHKLWGRRLRAGQSVLLTVTAARHKAERIALRILDGVKPRARLLR